MINVLLRNDFPSSAIEALRRIPEIELVFDDFSRLRSNRPFSFSQTVETVITDHRTPYQSHWDQAFPGLKLVVSLGLPPSWDQTKQVSGSGVELRFTADAGTVSVAEMAMASMVCLSRRQVWLDENEDAEPRADEIHGKTLGIIGFGRIGKNIAQLAHAFGMTILYHDLRGGEGGPSARSVPLNDLLSSSDYISCNLPLNQQTKGLLDRTFFEQMRPGTYLIDMSQEGVVDVAAMKAALDDHRLAGVSADVYDRNRQKELGLDRYPHCIWLPLRSAVTRQTQIRAGEEAVRIVKEYFNV